MSVYVLAHPYLTSSLSTLTASVSPAVALARDDNRGGFLLTVSGSRTAYIGFGFQPTSTSYNIFLNYGDYYEDSIGFKGIVYVTFSDNDSNTMLQATSFTKGGL